MTDEKLKAIMKQVQDCCPIVNQSNVVAAFIKAEAMKEVAQIQSKAIILAAEKIKSGLQTVANNLT